MSPARRVLVTGAAGFIGMHVTERLLAAGCAVTGVDNLDPYYDVALKEARLARLSRHDSFRFERLDLVDAAATARLFRDGALRGSRPPRGAARRAPFAGQTPRRISRTT